jgi:hypothetical protein
MTGNIMWDIYLSRRVVVRGSISDFRKLPKHTPKGLADILALKPRRTVFVEVKGRKGGPLMSRSNSAAM